MKIHALSIQTRPLRGARAGAMLLGFLTILTTTSGCFPSNRLEDTSSSNQVTLDNSTASDGAQGQCLKIDRSRPERNICIDCYASTLAARCPGKTDPSQCLDQTVVDTFTNLVNQCILQTLNSGSSCTKTCTSGLVLDRTSCTCILPPGGGNIPPVDSGQTNYGPPLVDLIWPAFPAATGDLNSCTNTAKPLSFLVQNRGDTVPQFNQYHVTSYSCTHTGATGYLSNVLTPSWSSGSVESEFNLTTSGQAELVTTNTLATPADLVLQNARTGGARTITVPALAEGSYVLDFDLQIANNWKGAGVADSADGPHGFKATRTSGPTQVVLLNNTFSSLLTYPQSFPGIALSKGIDTGNGSGADAVFRIALPVVHACVVGPCDLVFSFNAEGSFLDLADDNNEQKWGMQNISLRKSGIQNFESDATPWTTVPVVADPRETVEGVADFSSFLGAFSGTDRANLSLDRIPAGKYFITFDFYLIDAWFGEGAGVYSSYPIFSTGLTTASTVSAGNVHGCAVLAGGAAACWGSNQNGQLGNGETPATSPYEATAASPKIPDGADAGSEPDDLINVAAIAAGGKHTCAIAGGIVRCWGYNGYGQLGTGNLTSTTVGMPLGAPPAGIPEQVAAGDNHTCSIFDDGAQKAYCWGQNSSGQLGNGASANSSAPVLAIAGVKKVAAGGRHSCAVMADNTVKCWGDGSSGQVGDLDYGNHSTPFTVAGLANVTDIAVGFGHSCALISGGTVKCWGDNSFGQLGTASADTSATPVAVSAITAASSISAGATHTCAVLTTNEVQCWGDNTGGKLGNGNTVNSKVPVTVKSLALTGATTVTAVAAGGTQSCARLSTGKVQCWGSNALGQLGAPLEKQKFEISYGTTKIFSHSFSNTDYPQSYRGQATVLKSNMGFLTADDSIYHLNVVFNHSCATSAPCDLNLTFAGSGLDEARSWGLDNFGLTPLPECGIQYSFTDTNQLTSNYCLRINPFTSCGQTSTTLADQTACDCWASPIVDDLRPGFAPLSANESCP